MNQIHHTNSSMTKIISGAVIVIALSFFGGFSYGKSVSAANQVGTFAGRTGGAGFGGTGLGATGSGGGARRAAAGSGFATGEVLSRDASGVTLKLQDGGTKIVFIATSTQVMKATSGSFADLAVGTSVTIMGTTNGDGSIAAKSVQIRPQGTTERRSN